MLPETTVALVQIADISEAIAQLSDGTIGALLDDEAVSPICERVIEEAYDAYSKFEEKVGLSLDELREIPAGEIVFATIAPRRQNLVYMIVLEVGDGNEAAEKVFEIAMENVSASEDAAIEKTTLASGLVVNTLQFDGNAVHVARREGLVIGCSNKKVLNDFFIRWDGGKVPKVRSLNENRKFITVMNQCRSRNDSPLDLRFFFDPFRTIKSWARGNFAAQAMTAMLPAVGLDGILAMGGSVILGNDDYDWIVHGRLLLSNPRNAITNVIALKLGDYFPEPWIPEACSLYTSTSLDVGQAYEELSKMTDLISDEGTFDNFIPIEIRDIHDVSLKEDILAHFTGRISYAQIPISPDKFNGESFVVSLELSEVEAFTETIEKVADQINAHEGAPAIDQREFEGFTYWTRSDAAVEAQQDRKLFRQERRESWSDPEVAKAQRKRFELQRNMYRTSRPLLRVIGEHLFLCDSIEAFEAAVSTVQGETLPLGEAKDFTGFSDHMDRLLDADTPCAIVHANPKMQVERMLKLANADSARSFIAGMAEKNDFLNRANGILEGYELPSMEVIEKHIGVQGGFLTTGDRGYHFLWFQERP